jgi:hypothetical protein
MSCFSDHADHRLARRVLFMPDQLRFDSLGHTGNPVIKTPRMDQFAREGTRFTSMFIGISWFSLRLKGILLMNIPLVKDCFTQASVCTQSRCSM